MRLQDFWRALRGHLNFFRVHVIFFTLAPLIFSGIFYASNGRYSIAYIDALFNSVSAMAVCGLVTINLSQLTPWQQVLLFIQMSLGSPVLVSWVVVYIRRYYFVKKLDYVIQAEVSRRAAAVAKQQLTATALETPGRTRNGWSRRMFHQKSDLSTVPEHSSGDNTRTISKENAKSLTPDMIRRMDTPPRLVNPSGWIASSSTTPTRHTSRNSNANMQMEERAPPPRQLTFADGISQIPEHIDVGTDIHASNIHIETDIGRRAPIRRLSNPEELQTSAPVPTTVQSGSNVPHESSTTRVSPGMPRTTIDFATTVSHPHSPTRDQPGHPDSPSSVVSPNTPIEFPMSRRRRSSTISHAPVAQCTTTQTRYDDSWGAANLHPPPSFDYVDQPREHMLRGFGGFPMPHELLGMLFSWLFPGFKNRLKRTTTIPITTTLTSTRLGHAASGAAYDLGRPARGEIISATDGSKPVSYISFDAVVKRNSVFHLSTSEQLEELGGVEYRALCALLWLVAGYHIAIQLVSFVVIAPYMSMSKWRSNFELPAQFKNIAPPWFSLFQVVSAYTNVGTSLVDQNMIPFQTAYPMIFFLMLCILAGNTAFPVLLRLLIWTITKLVPQNSGLRETLHFLLDHPRRCFIYLFPSHQTWFLFTVLVILNFTDWFCFMVLDIGNPDIDSIPLGTRFVAGLFQSIAVRAAGFSIVPLAGISPAVKVMYTIMMYVSVYPIALSVRSTNVYEEQSLGIYRHDNESETAFSTTGPRMTVWSRYLAMHARRQLAFDMWWLCLALVLICIIERGNLTNTEIQGWFNIFTIIFELVSAYGSVGLSLGMPNENYSFSGALHPLSKLVICAVMLRGRHRGLPAAIDRAILLPSEFTKTGDESAVHATHDDSSHSEFSFPKEDMSPPTTETQTALKDN